MKQKFVFMPGTTRFVPFACKSAIPNLKQHCLSRRLRRDKSGWDVTCYALTQDLPDIFLVRDRGLKVWFDTEQQAQEYADAVPGGFIAWAEGCMVQVYKQGKHTDRSGMLYAYKQGLKQYKPKRGAQYIQNLKKWAQKVLGVSGRSKDGVFYWD